MRSLSISALACHPINHEDAHQYGMNRCNGNNQLLPDKEIGKTANE